MTDREIKFELAKIALTTGRSVEHITAFYDWIMEEPEHIVVESKPTKWDDTPIEDLACRTRIKGTITKRCHDNGINTVGDLIRCGGHKFRTFDKVGYKTITVIDDMLEQYFGISDWYTM